LQQFKTASWPWGVTHVRALITIFGCLAAAALVGYVVAGGGTAGHIIAIVTFGALFKLFMARGW
jgi:hypothetical protein